MRVSDFDDFASLETEGLLTGSKERNWLWFGLIISLGLHVALCAYFYRTRFQPVEAVFAQIVQHRAVVREQVFDDLQLQELPH